jgi:hypothetical protein
MKNLALTPLILLLGFTLTQHTLAQSAKNPVTTVVREMLERQQKNLIAAVEQMPAAKFSYSPTPEQMSFAHLVIHIADSNYHLCSLLAEVPAHKAFDPTGKEGKDELVAALKDSFDYCNKAVAAMDDSKLADTIKGHHGDPAPRAWAAIALTNDWADHYGAAAMYLRLNGMLPPTAKK